MGAAPNPAAPSETKGVLCILTGSFDNGPPSSFLYTTSRGLREIKVPAHEHTTPVALKHTRASPLVCIAAFYGGSRFRLARPITSTTTTPV